MRQELIYKLQMMQMWRRGANMEMPYTGKEFGIMIDDCIKILHRLTDKQVEQILKKHESSN